MGVDLTLLPVHHETDEGDMVCVCAFDLDLRAVIDPFLDMERHRPTGKVFWPIEKVTGDMPNLWRSAPSIGGPLQDSRFGWSTQDTSYVLAEDVQRTFTGLESVLAEVNDFERAAIAYISALEPNTKVFLHWW